MRPRAIAIVLLSVWCTPARSADENGHFAIKGVGLTTCQQFVEARSARSPRYFQYGGWINGYLSATNRYESNTFDVASWHSTGLLAGWLTRYCERNPEAEFVRAVGAMVNALGPERLTTDAPRVAATVGETTIHIYRPTLQRVQERLAEQGHYAGTPSGTYDQPTRTALEAYQAEHGLEPNGLPDQATLARILR